MKRSDFQLFFDSVLRTTFAFVCFQLKREIRKSYIKYKNSVLKNIENIFRILLNYNLLIFDQEVMTFSKCNMFIFV